MEQIELDLLHHYLDLNWDKKDKETFTDHSFEDYDKETDELDKRLYIEEEIETEPQTTHNVPTKEWVNIPEEDWEEVD